MGSRGPLKIPKHLQAVPEPGATAAGSMAERVAPSAPDRPPGFPVDDREMCELWDAMVPELDRAGLLTRADGPTVELALRHFLAARQAGNALQEGEVVVGDAAHGHSVKKNPAGAEMRSQSQLFLEYAKQLGMSFAARARMPAADEAAEANPFA
ncbi:P27 family phage terminase small subunit [Streptomyces lonarensis]|uniref:P27 family phage terminase small subunit n=1 Tax=Streptomyces lonarensis TaxID=700599 RepID=A0A7X6CXL7_9ACTN|nr:P27 family phage terminase small subunit [Streptomyces lonarensis]NJQ04279.1 P27 family phage terminase small subunit [Streptomyces lonarensis]